MGRQETLRNYNERQLKKYYPLVARVAELEPGVVALSDEGLKN